MPSFGLLPACRCMGALGCSLHPLLPLLHDQPPAPLVASNSATAAAPAVNPLRGRTVCRPSGSEPVLLIPLGPSVSSSPSLRLFSPDLCYDRRSFRGRNARLGGHVRGLGSRWPH